MHNKIIRKIVFVTGTRADFGKLKSLIRECQLLKQFDTHIFVTGMHLLTKYGNTVKEIEDETFKNIFKYINQTENSNADIILSNTIIGFSNYLHEIKPDLIVVHGDRLEALACTIVGTFNNTLVAHIEGGEVSGTLDESIRHAISKFAHIHLVANMEAKNRIKKMGEALEGIFIIGSPDIDIMRQNNLPNLKDVNKHYEIDFLEYNILIFHSVTTEIETLSSQIKEIVDAIIESQLNYIIIKPNNDLGSKIILKEYDRFINNRKIRLFPSVRFEYFLTLLKNSGFIIGNSSVGVREAMVYGTPCINIGTRQNNRVNLNIARNIISIPAKKVKILNAMSEIENFRCSPMFLFGNGDSATKFKKLLENGNFWNINKQKIFFDYD